jgi:hypothetical protein
MWTDTTSPSCIHFLHFMHRTDKNSGLRQQAIIMKSKIFWDITLCSPLKVNRRFGGTYRLHLQGRNISWARNQEALLATCFHVGFLLGLFFDPEDGGDVFLRNVSWLSTDYTALHPRRLYSSKPPLWEAQILQSNNNAHCTTGLTWLRKRQSPQHEWTQSFKTQEHCHNKASMLHSISPYLHENYLPGLKHELSYKRHQCNWKIWWWSILFSWATEHLPWRFSSHWIIQLLLTSLKFVCMLYHGHSNTAHSSLMDVHWILFHANSGTNEKAYVNRD